MDQSLRHEYLDAMGITSWLPRRQLQAARPTPDWVFEFCWPEQAPAGTAQSSGGPTASRAAQPAAAQAMVSPEASRAAAKQARAELNASLSGESLQSVKTPVESAPTAEQAESAAVASADVALTPVPPSEPEYVSAAELDTPVDKSEQAPFKLSFMSYGDCLVIDSLPPHARQSASQADTHQQILLDKILRSIGLQGGTVANYYMLPWPMFASKSLDQGPEQARMTVQHKLKKTLEKQPVPVVLLLGQAAAQMVLERSEPLEQLRGMLFSLRSDVKTLASASLTEMMTVPGCKREVWSDLQPLLDHLEKSAGAAGA